jgi:hypothetical protein
MAVIVIGISIIGIVGIFVAIAGLVIGSGMLAFALAVCFLAPVIVLIILARPAPPKT